MNSEDTFEKDLTLSRHITVNFTKDLTLLRNILSVFTKDLTLIRTIWGTFTKDLTIIRDIRGYFYKDLTLIRRIFDKLSGRVFYTFGKRKQTNTFYSVGHDVVDRDKKKGRYR